MKMKYLIPAVLLLASLSFQTAAQPTITITQGDTDTVYTKKIYVVGYTEPSASVSINGKPVKVYRTGAFGDELTLGEGRNNIEVSANADGETSKCWNVFYTRKRPASTSDETSGKYREKEFYAVTKKNAYLQASNVGDRLGASKLGFIDEGIVLKVVGEIDDAYRVQLSSNRYAFIEKQYVEQTTDTAKAITTGKWTITNEGDRDRIKIAVSGKVPYISSTELNPTIINVDLFNATDVSTWVTQFDEPGMIDYVNIGQIDSDIYRATIKLKDTFMWGYSVHYDDNCLVIEIRHTPERLTLKNLTIGIDAGHGGSATGAISTTGILEKDVNLTLAYLVKNLLEGKGAKVVMSRTDDSELTMPERKKIFLDGHIDLLVSIHNNAAGSPLVPMGASTYYKYIQNRQLAACLLGRMLELSVPSYGMTGNFNFALNSPTEYPNALVECLFMSSLPDEEMLSDPNVRNAIATKIVCGIEDYLKIVENDLKAAKRK